VKNADCIVVMEGGKKKDVGTHRELLRDSATYRQLVKRQMQLGSDGGGEGGGGGGGAAGGEGGGGEGGGGEGAGGSGGGEGAEAVGTEAGARAKAE
jgi:hypothetical protein